MSFNKIIKDALPLAVLASISEGAFMGTGKIRYIRKKDAYRMSLKLNDNRVFRVVIDDTFCRSWGNKIGGKCYFDVVTYDEHGLETREEKSMFDMAKYMRENNRNFKINNEIKELLYRNRGYRVMIPGYKPNYQVLHILMLQLNKPYRRELLDEIFANMRITLEEMKQKKEAEKAAKEARKAEQKEKEETKVEVEDNSGEPVTA